MRKAKERSHPHGIHRHQINGKVLPTTSCTPHMKTKRRLNKIRMIGHRNTKLSTESASTCDKSHHTVIELHAHARHDMDMSPSDRTRDNYSNDMSPPHDSPRILVLSNRDEYKNEIQTIIQKHEKEMETRDKKSYFARTRK